MIRFILAIIVVAIYFILSLPLLLIFSLVRLISPRAAVCALQRIVGIVCRIVLLIAGTRVTTIGREKVPDGEAVLYVANHQSIIDTLIPLTQLQPPYGYIAKDNLGRIPVLSWNMRFLSCLFLDREDLRQGLEVIKAAIELGKNGTSVFIYPEGTRNKGNDETVLLPFHRGSFKIAQRTGCKIVPIAFNNVDAVFERQFPKLRKAHVIVEYGDPVAYGDLTKEEQKHIDEYFRDKITEMVKRNHALI